MTAALRRAKGFIAKIVSLAANPSTITRAAEIYALVWAGTKQVMARDSDGQVYQVTPIFGTDRMSFYYCEDFVSTGMTTITLQGLGASALTQVLAGSPGIQRSTVTTSATPDAVRITATNVIITSMLVGGGNPIFFEGRCRTPTVQDATDQWSDRWGLGDGAVAADATDGLYFESNRTVNGDNNVRLCAAAAGTRTKTTMGVAPTANTFERWKLILNGGGTSVQGYLNDVLTGAAVTTNIPTAGSTGMWWLQLIKTAGTTNARSVDRDYAETYQMFSAGR